MPCLAWDVRAHVQKQTCQIASRSVERAGHQESLWQLGCEEANSSETTRSQEQGGSGGLGEPGDSGMAPGPQVGMSAGSSWGFPRAEAEASYYNKEQQAQVEAYAQDLLDKQDYTYKACTSLLEKCQGLGQSECATYVCRSEGHADDFWQVCVRQFPRHIKGHKQFPMDSEVLECLLEENPCPRMLDGPQWLWRTT